MGNVAHDLQQTVLTNVRQQGTPSPHVRVKPHLLTCHVVIVSQIAITMPNAWGESDSCSHQYMCALLTFKLSDLHNISVDKEVPHPHCSVLSASNETLSSTDHGIVDHGGRRRQIQQGLLQAEVGRTTVATKLVVVGFFSRGPEFLILIPLLLSFLFLGNQQFWHRLFFSSNSGKASFAPIPHYRFHCRFYSRGFYLHHRSRFGYRKVFQEFYM